MELTIYLKAEDVIRDVIPQGHWTQGLAPAIVNALQSAGMLWSEGDYEMLRWLYDNAPVDFLGTGSHSDEARKDEREWRAKFESLIEKSKTDESYINTFLNGKNSVDKLKKINEIYLQGYLDGVKHVKLNYSIAHDIYFKK